MMCMFPRLIWKESEEFEPVGGQTTDDYRMFRWENCKWISQIGISALFKEIKFEELDDKACPLLEG